MDSKGSGYQDLLSISGSEMMRDRVFLLWLRDRLINVYGESEHVDFVQKLTAIINATPDDQLTINRGEAVRA